MNAYVIVTSQRQDVIQVFTATRHHHGREAIEKWFDDKVTFVALSPSTRESMTRDYLSKVITEIHENAKRVSPNSRIFFLMTGHPFLNSVALYALRRKLGPNPFLLLVYDGIGDYHAFSSDFVLETIVPTDGITNGHTKNALPTP